jgi:hypothetical protein
LGHEGVDEPVMVHISGDHGLLCAGGAGDRGWCRRRCPYGCHAADGCGSVGRDVMVW